MTWGRRRHRIGTDQQADATGPDQQDVPAGDDVREDLRRRHDVARELARHDPRAPGPWDAYGV
jgi:hypothetical protein